MLGNINSSNYWSGAHYLEYYFKEEVLSIKTENFDLYDSIRLKNLKNWLIMKHNCKKSQNYF